MTKILFFLFSAINSTLKGKIKANNQRDFFKFLSKLGVREFHSNYLGVDFLLDPVNSSVSSRLVLQNDFEKSDIQNLISLVPHEGNFLDIGGNIGLYSCLISSNRPEVKVYAFEPANHVFRTLLQNTSVFKNVLPINLGLGNDNSIHTFFEYEDDALSSFVEGERSKLVRVNNAFVMKGDDFISTYKLENICGIKIDVEGFELDVIRGLATTLSEQSPIIQIELIHTVPNAHETHKLLLELGYTAFYWEGDILTGTDLLKSTEYNYIYKKLTS